jgi:phosphatidylethanolamine/phosphatidyl-N-methylethanolamine N-methyltransferase
LLRKVAESDRFVFLRSCAQAPFMTAAMMPSGQDLSRVVAASVDLERSGPVVELGPGTGPVTAALIERGIAPERLVLIEFNPQFCELLRTRYPRARVIHGDAFAAPAILRALNAAPLAAVVSFLPLYGLTPATRQRLLIDLLRMGQSGTPFIQSTYLPRSPIPIDHGVMHATASPRVWRNVPPAVVWTYRLCAIACASALGPPGETGWARAAKPLVQ